MKDALLDVGTLSRCGCTNANLIVALPDITIACCNGTIPRPFLLLAFSNGGNALKRQHTLRMCFSLRLGLGLGLGACNVIR
jgi:hypothetical protein